MLYFVSVYSDLVFEPVTSPTVTKKVVGVFVRFRRAPLQEIQLFIYGAGWAGS
jgi:hypothetical protein